MLAISRKINHGGIMLRYRRGSRTSLQREEEEPMKVIAIRHAEAVERNGTIVDEGRYLTPEGRFLFRKTCKTLLSEGIDPNLILTSPWLRAAQTADILAERIDYVGSLLPVPELAPGFDLNALQQLLTAYYPVKELVLVGHEPDLSALLKQLLPLPDGFSLAKGSALKFCVDPKEIAAGAEFKWLAVGKKLTSSIKKLA